MFSHGVKWLVSCCVLWVGAAGAATPTGPNCLDSFFSLAEPANDQSLPQVIMIDIDLQSPHLGQYVLSMTLAGQRQKLPFIYPYPWPELTIALKRLKSWAPTDSVMHFRAMALLQVVRRLEKISLAAHPLDVREEFWVRQVLELGAEGLPSLPEIQLGFSKIRNPFHSLIDRFVDNPDGLLKKQSLLFFGALLVGGSAKDLTSHRELFSSLFESWIDLRTEWFGFREVQTSVDQAVWQKMELYRQIFKAF